jgi:outer membrane protein W
MGFSFAWNVFDEKTSGTFTTDNGAITGTARRWVNSLPFLLTCDFYLNRQNAIKPFIGIGAGAYYIVQRLDVGVWTVEKTNWHFGIAPEVGFQIPLGDIEGIIAARYNYAFAAGESVTGDAEEYQYLTGIVGLAYTRW